MTSSYPDSASIQTMFDRLAKRYDLFNRLTSAGQDSKWRKIALENIRPGMSVLDLGCGTGDLALEAKIRAKEGEVVGLDFSQKMLEIARRRAPHVLFIQGSAEDLPIPGQGFDCVVSGFVLRNIFRHIDAILQGVYASLKEGGEISFLDFTEPGNPVWRGLWKFYMRTVVAVYGLLLFGKDYPTTYMTESAERFVKPAEFIKKLQEAGFKNVTTRFFLFGIIVLYRASK